MTYFSPEPKRRKEDFFNMEEELEKMKKGLKGKLVVVTGLRRTGKTSLILTFLNEEKIDYIYIDCRLLPAGMFSLDSFIEILEEELNRKSWAKRLLERVDGIKIGEFGIRLGRKESNLLAVLRALEGKVLVIDEAQELRRSPYKFSSILAYAFDHLDLKIIVSGSMFGVLYNFLGFEEPQSPLYGRAFTEIRLERLSDEKAREFLKRGFEQEGMEVDESVIEEGVRRFDGIIGWLSYYGFSVTTSGESLESISLKASKLAMSELMNALEIYGIGKKRYLEAMKIVANLGNAKWSDIKRGIEAKLGRVPNNTLSTILRNLVDSGFLEKVEGVYRIPDPVLRDALLEF